MKICVFGAGAIGGWLAARLAAAGADVSVVARGARLEAIRAKGLRVQDLDGRVTATRVRCSAITAELGAQDFVIIATKAHDAAAAVPVLAPLLGPETAVVTAMNGLPWWYFHKQAGPFEDHRLRTLDPDDAQWRGITPERALGAVIWAAAETPEPGVIRHLSGERIPIGEPDGSRSARAVQLSGALRAAGLKSPVRTDIRTEIWLKLWGNLSFNPVSVLTHATLEDMARDPGTRALIRTMMLEAEQVAAALGVTMPMSIEQRIRGAEAVGAHLTSTLQDLLQGRPLELDALLGAVVECAALARVPVPTLDFVYALAAQRARTAGCQPVAPAA